MALDELAPGALELLKSPNNNLALAYIKRIREKNYRMETLHIKRTGAGFHERDAQNGGASASAIREMIALRGVESIREFAPKRCCEILSGEIAAGHAVIGHDRFWRAVRQAALRAETCEIADVADMREGFENKIKATAYASGSLDAFLDMCTSRRYPRGRVQRHCAHLLLNMRDAAGKRFQENGPAYIRVLGTNEKGREILRAMRDTATLPVLSKPGGRISPYAWETMRFERAATEIWETLTDSPRQGAESRVHAII
jgi:predicted nucleotidyltransferase